MRASTFLAAVLASLPLAAAAATFEVGPGGLAKIGDVPWESLEPGDEVLIHWRAEPYREKWVLCRRGSAEAPIVVRGVPGPNGELPVIDGNGATTRAELNFWNEARGVVKIGGANVPADTLPAYLVLENLEIRSGRPPYSFTGRDGPTDYARNAAAVYIEKGEHLVLRNLVLHDAGNGLFCGAQASDLLVERCRLYGNGNEGSAYEHNAYTAAVGITYQFNRFGPLRAGCDGNNLKDRSVGTVVRYNWIEGGNRQLDLVDAEDDPSLTGDPRYRATFVYGNVLVEPDGDGNSQIVHYGGDSGATGQYRKGTLHFVNNTVVSLRSGNTTLMRLSTDEETADLRNNVVWTLAPGAKLALLDASGRVELRDNWLKAGWVDSHGTLTGEIADLGGNLGSDAPGFFDASAGRYALAAGSECLDRGGALDGLLPEPLAWQYAADQAGEPRPVDGPLDLGAFERCQSGSCLPVDAGTADAGAPEPEGDAGLAPDAGVPDVGAPDAVGEPDSGCGCSSAGAFPAWLPLLAAPLLALRRRRP